MDTQEEKFPPRQSIAEWFASLGLQEDAKSERFMAQLMKVFSRNKYLFFLLIACVAIPFLIVPILFFVNAYTLFPPLPGVEYKEWVSFLGGYLGGAITFGGVFLSIRQMKKAQIREEEIRKIEKEYDVLSDFVQKIDPYFCNNTYYEFATLTYISREQYVSYLHTMQSKISEKLSLINIDNIYTNAATEIFDIMSKCDACKNTCNLYKIKKEFIAINAKQAHIRERIIDVQRLVKNKIDTVNIMNLESNTRMLIEKYPGEDFSENLRTVEQLKITLDNVDELKMGIVKNLEKLAEDYVNDYIPKMITLLKFYKHERLKSVAKHCM